MTTTMMSGERDVSSLLLEENGVLTFGIGRNDPWPSILEKLELLRETDLADHPDIQFCIWPEAAVSEVAEFLVETLECCSRKGYSWGRLVFQDFDIYDGTHHAVLNAACRNELFKYLWIAPLATRGFRASAERINEETAHVLRDAMIMNSSMEEICLFMQLTQEAFAVLGDGLRQTRSLKTLSLHLGWSRQHEDTFLPPFRFIQGLQENTSLQTLEIDGFPEEWPENILYALVDHPTLTTLSLKKCSWGEASFHALGSLISSPKCALTTLDISYPDILLTRQIDTDLLSTAMKSSCSIQILKLRYCGLDHIAFSKLWSRLSCWRKLIDIDITGNQVSSLDSVKSNITRLKRIDISHNPILTDEAHGRKTGLAEFLTMHPELKSLGQQFKKSKCYSPDLQHLLDINTCGRVLFCDGFQTHYSMWPTVLERANIIFQESPHRQANVLFHLIYGLSTSL
jgi:hypothetical protein